MRTCLWRAGECRFLGVLGELFTMRGKEKDDSVVFVLNDRK